MNKKFIEKNCIELEKAADEKINREIRELRAYNQGYKCGCEDIAKMYTAKNDEIVKQLLSESIISPADDEAYITLDRAIEIVKGGGVDEKSKET